MCQDYKNEIETLKNNQIQNKKCKKEKIELEKTLNELEEKISKLQEQ